jgi:coproporphyrinogen III oxidase-like Fe-S oxidoreductase
MLTEIFLRYYAKRITQRYLAFKKCSSCSPPRPTENGRYLLYIHIPFCEELCPYCSFIRIKFEPALASDYFDVLKKEIETYYNLGYHFDSVYVGGGTPTIVPDKLADIISFAKTIWPVTQISIETNPNHLVPEILRILKDIGTNRLSIGVQSFNNEILESIQRLERYGTGEEIKEKISSVVGMFDTVNIDMIFNFPNQTEQMLAADIKIIKEINADQITYYPLIVSKSKEKEIARKCGKSSYEKEKRLYQLVVEQLTDTYNQESVWCFTNKRELIDEYIVNHDEYAGVGPGSWGYVNGTMYSNTFSIQQYIRMMQENKSPIITSRSFSYLERMRYCFLLKLLGGTLSVSEMKEKYGNHFWFYLSRELLFLFMIRAVAFRDNNFILTPKGRYYWVILMRTLFSVVGDHRDTYAKQIVS